MATQTKQIIASSLSGALAHFWRKSVDLKMGIVLLSGGLLCAALGVLVFKYLQSLVYVEFLIRLFHVVFLGVIAGMMFIESLRAMQQGDNPAPVKIF